MEKVVKQIDFRDLRENVKAQEQERHKIVLAKNNYSILSFKSDPFPPQKWKTKNISIPLTAFLPFFVLFKCDVHDVFVFSVRLKSRAVLLFLFPVLTSSSIWFISSHVCGISYASETLVFLNGKQKLGTVKEGLRFFPPIFDSFTISFVLHCIFLLFKTVCSRVRNSTFPLSNIWRVDVRLCLIFVLRLWEVA